MDGSRTRVFTILYFVAAIIEIFAERFSYTSLILVAKPSITLLLLLIYLESSPRKNFVFIVAMLFSMVTNFLFIPNTQQMLFYGILAFLIHRILIIYLLVTLIKIRDFIPTCIATIPFLLVFFYLFYITDSIPENSFFIIVVSNILISVLGGIAVGNYVMVDSKSSSLLLLAGLLLVLLQLLVFVERYYLTTLSPIILRPISMGFNVFAFYALCQYVIAAEREQLNDNSSTVGI